MRQYVDLPVSLRDLTGPLSNVAAWAEALIAAVPPEHRASARVEYSGDEYGDIFVYYDRPETDDERAFMLTADALMTSRLNVAIGADALRAMTAGDCTANIGNTGEVECGQRHLKT